MIYGRSPRQLLVVWGLALGVVALLYAFEKRSPAFHEMVVPIYWIVLPIAVLFTWRWLRARSSQNRRGGDRRRSERRRESASPEN